MAEEAIEEQAALAADAVRRKLRANIGQIATSILSDYSIERSGHNILIRVEIRDKP